MDSFNIFVDEVFKKFNSLSETSKKEFSSEENQINALLFNTAALLCVQNTLHEIREIMRGI